MKLKLKLDQKSIQEFLLQNVEKFVLGIVVLIFVAMSYAALRGLERYPKTPEQLLQAAKDGQRTIDATQPKPVTLTDYVTLAQRSREPVSEAPYATASVWDASLFPKKELRPIPAVFTVQQLRGAADKGAIGGERGAGGGGGSGLRGKRWVVVTGLVPIEQQTQAYLDAFRTAAGYEPVKDAPEYLGFWVQRAEVNSPADVANLDWDKVPVKISKAEIDDLTRQGLVGSAQTDIIGKEYVHQHLTFPLPSKVSKLWTESIAHAPEIPLASTGDERDHGGPGQGAERPPETPPVTEGNPFGFGDRPTGNTPAQPPPGAGRTRASEVKNPRYLLFRYFDFDTEPGKQYVYRVRLALKNPNYQKKSSEVKDNASTVRSYLETKWSDPTATIAMSGDLRVFARSVKPGRAAADTQGTVALAKWQENDGSENCTDVTVARGQLATPDGARTKINSDPIAVDFRGGQKITNSKNSPQAAGEVLLLNSDGTLLVRNELEDWPEYNKIVNQKPVESPPGGQPHGMPPGAGTPPPGGPGGPGGRPPAGLGAPPGGTGHGALDGMDTGPGGRRRPTRPPR